MTSPPKSRGEQIAELREAIVRMKAELTELQRLQGIADAVSAKLDSELQRRANPKKRTGQT